MSQYSNYYCTFNVKRHFCLDVTQRNMIYLVSIDRFITLNYYTKLITCLCGQVTTKLQYSTIIILNDVIKSC